MVSPKRSSTVEQIVIKNSADYSEVFKTRTKVIDDRPITPQKQNYVGHPLKFDTSPVGGGMNALGSKPAKPAGFSGQKLQSQNPLTIRTTGDMVNLAAYQIQDDGIELDGDLTRMLTSSSEVFLLPEVEQRYLEQYQLDSKRLSLVEQTVEKLNAKMKQVRSYLKARIEQEEQELNEYAIKIQAWYRGVRCRQVLQAQGIRTFKAYAAPERQYVDLNSQLELQRKLDHMQKEFEYLKAAFAKSEVENSVFREIIKSLKSENEDYELRLTTLTTIVTKNEQILESLLKNDTKPAET